MKKHFTIFALLLVTEIAIATLHTHKFIRGFIGDLLVVPLLYFFLKPITGLSIKKAILVVLFIAFTAEILQAFNMVQLMNIDHPILLILLGQTFDVFDLVAYCLGVVPILFIEKFYINENN